MRCCLIRRSEPSVEPAQARFPSRIKLDELTWPAALDRISPANIKRTASDFMKEWEKSFSPPPEQPAATGNSPNEQGL